MPVTTRRRTRSQTKQANDGQDENRAKKPRINKPKRQDSEGFEVPSVSLLPVKKKKRKVAVQVDDMKIESLDKKEEEQHKEGSEFEEKVANDKEVEENGNIDDEEVPPSLRRRLSWRQASVGLEYKESSKWVCVFTKVLPVRRINQTYISSVYKKYLARETTKELEKKYVKGFIETFKIESVLLKEEVRDLLESVSNEWINNFSTIILDYLGDMEDWCHLERVKLFLNMETLTSRIRKSGNCPYLDYRMRYMIDAIHKHTPRFPDTVSGLRKYKRAVPPRFALSLQSSCKASQHPSKKGLVRSGSAIKRMLRRQTSEGWEQHSASVDIEKILSRTLKPSKPLHYYQKRTLMWARSLEAEVRSGVKYRIPLKYFQPEEGEALPVGFDPINKRLFLEQDSNYKRPLHFSFRGGVIANEMGLGKTLSCIALVLTDRDYSILEKGDEKQAECYEISGTGNPIIDGIYMKGENGERKDCYTKFTLRGKELTGQMRLLKDIAMGSWMIKDADKPQYKRETCFPRRGLSYVNFGYMKYGDVDDIIKLNGKKCSVIKHKRGQSSRRAGVYFEEDGSEKKTMKIKRLSPTKFPLREGRTLTNATLVICPSHLAKQWKQEVTAFLHPGLKKSIKVHVVTTMPQLAKLNFDAIREADMIVVSIQLFLNPNYQKLSLTHLVDTMEHRNGVYDYLARLQQHPVIEAFFWKRIILDEGHEIFAKAIMNQKTPVMDVMMAIKSETRWYVSGTPFPDNDLTPRGALRFLRVKIDGVEVLEQEARGVISDKTLMGYKQRLQNSSRYMYVRPLSGYNQMLFRTRIGSFLDHMLYSRMYCRYTTLFVKGVYKVPDYDTEVVRLAMHPYERVLYEDEAMRIDCSRDTMRQLCAHPAVNCVNAPRCIRRGRGHTVREQISLDISLYLRQQAARLGNQHRMIVEEINSIRRGEDATGYYMASNRSRGDTEILLRRYVYYENTLYPRMRLIFNLMREEKFQRVDDSFSGFPVEEPSHYAHIIRFIKAKAAMEKRLNLQLSFKEAIQLRKEERKEKSDRDLTWAQAHEDAKITETLKQSIASHRAQGTRSIYQSDHWGGYRSSFLQTTNSDNYEEIEDDALPPHYSAKDFELPAVAPHMTEDAVTKNGSKITYVVSRLKQLLEEGARVILFSQWQRLFQGLQQVLDDEEIKYVLVRGNVHVRTGAIRKFNTDPDVKVIMLSLDSSASGANLQKASHVILLDPPAGTKEEADAIEAQAIGRAHRQGQDKKLKVIRIVMRDSIEEELLQRKEETIEWMQS